MKPNYTYESFFEYLTSTYWYVETVDLYFRKRYRAVFDDVMEELTGKKQEFGHNVKTIIK